MDNITHSLAGLLLAEAAVQLRARLTRTEPSPRLRTVAAIASMIAANLPDADLLYTGVGGDRLAYMLHHRGYTHTVVAALVAAIVLWAGVMIGWRWLTRGSVAPGDARWLPGLLAASVLSHLLLDWTNSYGLHPFWPIDNRWFYGDSVFIVEPWFWVVSAPALIAASRSLVARALLAAVMLGGLALAWRVSLVAVGAAAALTVGALVAIVITRLLRPAARPAFAIGAWISVTLVMAAGAATARSQVSALARQTDRSATLVDVVVSPLPSNAVCTSTIVVELSGATYRVTTARASSAPWITPAARCPVSRARGGSFSTSTRRSTGAVHWDAEWSAPGAQLATLAAESCPALAVLRFVRVPLWSPIGDSTLMLGDARYGDGSGGAFTDVRVARHAAACPPNVPGWVPPRADVLRSLMNQARPSP